MNKVKHVLGLSGGKDSAALAIYMRDKYPHIDIDYFFTDTGKELPEVYSFLNDLEAYLGKEIIRLNDDRGFDHLLKGEFNGFLPSPKQRWCTIEMKLKPFERWIQPFLDDGYEIISYVGIRADEPYREGYTPTHNFLKVKFPFSDDGIDKAGVFELLDSSVGRPQYYKWRSRSGCSFCFYQQKIEWVRLRENHPDLFEDAKKYEKQLGETPSGEAYYWMGKDTPLSTLEDPNRVQEIKDNHKKRIDRLKKKLRRNALIDVKLIDDNEYMDELYDEIEGGGACFTCYK